MNSCCCGCSLILLSLDNMRMLPLHVLFFFHLMPKNADAEEPDALTMAPDLHSSPDAHNFPNL